MTATERSDQPVNPTDRTERRRAARTDAFVSVIRWFDVILDDFRELCDRAGVHGDNRVVCFAVGIDTDDNGDDGDFPFRESLRSAGLIGLANEVTLAPDTRLSEWPDAVALWLEMMECMGVLYAEQPSPCMIIDLDTRTVAAWEPYYCPDFGPVPSQLMVVATLDEANAPPVDPFESLLDDTPDDEANDAMENLLRALELHELEPPTTPGHEPGDCELD